MNDLMNANIRTLLWSLLFVTGLACLPVVPSYAQPNGTVHEYLSRDEALKEVFPKATQYLTETVPLKPAEVAQAEDVLHRELKTSSYEVILCYDAGGAFVGYAVISEEVGKYRPITFMVGITPRLQAEKVVIMVYREDRGGEVRTPRFLYQYRGKKASDPIRTNRDIINISGATLSVRAVNAGVKKVLYLTTEHFRNNPPAPTFEEERALHASTSDG